MASKEYEVAVKIAGQLDRSFNAAIMGAKAGLSGLGVSGKVGSLAMKGVGVAAKATAAAMAAAGAATIAVGAYSVNVGKQFEAQMSTVQSISGATGEEFEALKAKAKEMGSTTSFSATEAGQAMEYMAMAGWKSGDMINGIEGIMNLAAASGEELAMTSDIVTDALTAFGLSAKDSGHFADVLAAASSNANTNVAMLGESFQYAAPVAGALGISAEDTSIALGLMANAGIKASSAGTALRTGLTNLVKPTKQMQQYMDRYNISMVENADGSINLRDTMIDLREKMGRLSESEQTAAAAAIFGKNSMAGWLAIVNSSDQDFEKLTAAIDNCNGKAAEMAAIKLDNLEGDITLLKSAAEGFGISIYENMTGPLRDMVQYGQSQIAVLQNALNQGGFEGLAGAIGNVAADALTRLAERAPEFIDMGANMVEAFINGIDGNAGAIGNSAGKIGTSLASAFIRIMPKMIATGGKLLVAFGQGIIQNLPQLKDAAAEAVRYFMQAAKDAFKGFVNFLGDDQVAPFEKILSLVPLLVGGFAVVDGIGGSIKGLVNSFKGVNKASKTVKKSVGGAGSAMSGLAKNILGIGVGIGAAAAGMWLLADAATKIADAGPGAWIALVAMAGGIAALMLVASKLGAQLSTATPGLLAFGAAIILAGAGMAVMSYSAIQLTSAGGPAIAVFFGMAVAIAAFMAIAGALGPTLVAGGAGMLLLGAGLLVAAAGMALLANTAIQLSSAGAPAIAIMAGLAVGILVFGAAAGALSPLLIAGAVALGAFGAALAIVSAAAILGSTALLIISTALPSLAQYGAAGAVAIVELGAAMTLFSAGAAIAGAGAIAAGAGFGALAVAAGAASLVFSPLAAGMIAAATSITIISTSATKAVSGIKTLQSTFAALRTSAAKEINQAVTAVKNGVAAMKAAMKFSWPLPHLRVPHIKVSGSFSLEPPSAPNFSVSWYKQGGILSGAQIFGASGNTLLGGGEAGQEAVLPLDTLWTRMRSIMGDVVNGIDGSGMTAIIDRLDAMSAGRSETSVGEVLGEFDNGPDDDGYPGLGNGPVYTITFNPTYQFYGEAPTQEAMVGAARMSQNEFNDMMDTWVKDHNRKDF